MWLLEDKQTKEIENVYVQFSLKDPWWIPKYDPNFADGTIPLHGWLFFYFGRSKYGQTIEK